MGEKKKEVNKQKQEQLRQRTKKHSSKIVMRPHNHGSFPVHHNHVNSHTQAHTAIHIQLHVTHLWLFQTKSGSSSEIMNLFKMGQEGAIFKHLLHNLLHNMAHWGMLDPCRWYDWLIPTSTRHYMHIIKHRQDSKHLSLQFYCNTSQLQVNISHSEAKQPHTNNPQSLGPDLMFMNMEKHQPEHRTSHSTSTGHGHDYKQECIFTSKLQKFVIYLLGIII